MSQGTIGTEFTTPYTDHSVRTCRLAITARQLTPDPQVIKFPTAGRLAISQQQLPHKRAPTNAVSGNLACMTAIMLFAFGFPAAEHLLDTWGVVSLIAFRNTLALALLIALWTCVDGWRTVATAPWLTGIRIGSVGFGLGATLLLLAQSMTNAVTAALAAAAMPVAAVAFEVALDGRRLTGNFVGGVALVLIGGVLATGVNLSDASFGAGAVIGLFAASIFAWGSRSTVKSLPRLKPLGQTVVTTAGMALFTIAVYAVFILFDLPGAQATSLDNSGWMLMLIYAWVSLAISQSFWITGVGKLGVGLASFHLNAAPFYVMLILLALGGSWNWMQAFGALVLAAGVVIAQRKNARLPQ